MARHNISERWVRDIEKEVEEFKNFDANSRWRETVVEIFDETYDVGGIDPVEELGNRIMELVEHNRHPKSHRVRRIAREISSNYVEDIPATSSLLKSRNG
jgi:hypothetical protein